ncbi:glucose 1-dehydrogenase [Novosphingobium taihuense]|uniref:NAD(P)-dependent dehydrogenase (Short-subunit alcohol dehydrogenase family) n=1 Tax=Novosphingobium taihuense TaxID=260085 RepID=A0A7W7AFU6_9SPHN|nr:glucose 1-dehydrogenase [Novosphingobium taihuense]MBB4615479.1 NAD(P)-dependent dehydrogenase (short-subunit alcohol dehydrogenase family) [Novosphingobium taihuense]TWH82075.1 D-sorbitol dehydrogenase (acceptor) [Novosphingobium taihuense]
MRLSGRRALVTGAGSGLGREIAQAWAREGTAVLCCDANLETASETAERIAEAGGAGAAIGMDVAKDGDIEAAVALCVEQFGGIDLVLNAAGIVRYQPIFETTRESFRQTIDVNLFGTFFVAQAAARQMVAQGTGGAIINIASIAGRHGAGMALQYSASKAAVINLTQSLAQAMIGHGINVNAIAPGYMQTAMWDQIKRTYAGGALGATGEDIDLNVCATIAAGRLGVPSDLCEAAIFLASEGARYVVGQTLNIDGGVEFN